MLLLQRNWIASPAHNSYNSSSMEIWHLWLQSKGFMSRWEECALHICCMEYLVNVCEGDMMRYDVWHSWFWCVFCFSVWMSSLLMQVEFEVARYCISAFPFMSISVCVMWLRVLSCMFIYSWWFVPFIYKDHFKCFIIFMFVSVDKCVPCTNFRELLFFSQEGF